MLREHYRCHPTILRYFSTRFYHSQIVDGRSRLTLESDFPDLFGQSPVLGPFVFFDIEVGKQASSTDSARNYSNRQEAEFCIDLCSYFVEILADKGIALITPYQEQRQLLDRLMKSSKSNLSNVHISTVDGYQGREQDIVIFSCVRARSSIGFLADPRRLNVACTRAKKSLIFAGNSRTLSQNRMWKDLIDYARKEGIFVRAPQRLNHRIDFATGNGFHRE